MKKRDVHALFQITSGKKMTNYYALCFNRLHFIVTPSYIKLPWVLQNSNTSNNKNSRQSLFYPIAVQNSYTKHSGKLCVNVFFWLGFKVQILLAQVLESCRYSLLIWLVWRKKSKRNIKKSDFPNVTIGLLSQQSLLQPYKLESGTKVCVISGQFDTDSINI